MPELGELSAAHSGFATDGEALRYRCRQHQCRRGPPFDLVTYSLGPVTKNKKIMLPF